MKPDPRDGRAGFRPDLLVDHDRAGLFDVPEHCRQCLGDD